MYKLDKKTCIIISSLGYSYDDIAEIYSTLWQRPVYKGTISKLLKDVNYRKSPERINPLNIKQEFITYLQINKVYFLLVELFRSKYLKRVIR